MVRVCESTYDKEKLTAQGIQVLVSGCYLFEPQWVTCKKIKFHFFSEATAVPLNIGRVLCRSFRLI